MDNKKIPTWLGVVIIIIFSFTVGMFVWQWREKQNWQMPIDSIKNTKLQIQSKKNQLSNINAHDLQQNIQKGANTNKYINKTYGFEFDYLKNLVITEDSTENIFGLSNSSDGPWIMNITVSINKESLPLEQAVNNTIRRFAGHKIITNNIDVNGIPAKKYSVQNYGDSGNAGVVMVKGNNIITIYGDDSNPALKKIFETVINSFKFDK